MMEMDLIGINLIHKFKEKHAEAASQFDSWITEVKDADWNTPHELKLRYPKASLLKDRHVVFDICWNKYRLLVQISYKNRLVIIKKVGTHKEYDNWLID